jgi:hypothetical protein
MLTGRSHLHALPVWSPRLQFLWPTSGWQSTAQAHDQMSDTLRYRSFVDFGYRKKALSSGSRHTTNRRTFTLCPDVMLRLFKVARKGIVKLTGGFLNRTKPYDKSQTIWGL